jgi:dTDP-4-amino-4,6-dideoxygalactose transaminase
MQRNKSTKEQAETSRPAMELPVSGLLCKSAESALYLAIKACGVGPGDYLLAPDLGSADLAGALRRTGVLPLLFDVDPGCWLADLDLLEEFLMGNTMLNDADQLVMRRDGKAIRGIVIVHLNGNPADMDRLRFICDRFLLPLIEDATESVAAMFRSKPIGTFGETAACSLSRHPVGYATAAGLLLAKDEACFHRAQACGEMLDPHERPIPVQPGEVLHLPHETGEMPREYILQEHLREVPAIRFQKVHPLARQYSGAIALETAAAPELHAFLEQHQILTTSLAPPLHHLPSFRNSLYLHREDHATRLFEQVVVIPGLDLVTDEGFEKIASCIKRFFGA